MQVGKYQLIRELAIGGMAEVFLARTAGPMGFEKQLVLKRILPHLAKDPSFIQMFLSEATLAARLTHPNIVQIFDFGESDGAWFLAMEYIDGPSLRTLLDHAIERQLPLPPPVCARIIAGACEGLAFAHVFRDPATGQPLDIVHRDISPDNILLSRQGAVKVADFGIAKATGQRHRTKTGLIKGKLPYMPPEQLRAQELDQRVDVYALGIVFYELVTGQRPFDAPTDASLMQSILFEPPMPAVLRNPDLPEPVQKIIRRAIAKDRDQRYPDCLAFQADLEQYILSTGKPVTTLHVAQLIAQISPPREDAPLPPLPPGSPPLEDTTIRKAPAPAQNSAPAQDSIPAPAPAAQVQAPAAPSPDTAAPVAPPRSGGMRRLALAVMVLLASGGGYLLLRTSSSPAQPTPTVPPPTLTTLPEPTPPPDDVVAVANPAEPAPEPPPDLPTPPPEPPPPEPVAPPEDGAPATTTRPQPAEDPRPAQGERMGIIEFQIKPSAIVFLEGKRLGLTPLGPVKIAEGTYTVRVVNRELKKDVKGSVEVKAGQTAYVKVDLRAKSPP